MYANIYKELRWDWYAMCHIFLIYITHISKAKKIKLLKTVNHKPREIFTEP